MGLILSRYRKKKNSEEVLEQLQKDIDNIESKLHYASERQKVIVGKLLIYSIVFYILMAIVTYFYLYPETWKGKMLSSLPLIGLPVLVFYARQFVSWIYKRDITKSKDKLCDLLIRKKKILEDVMNTETYKKAKEILDKYAPEQTKKQSPLLQAPLIQPKTPVHPRETPQFTTGQKPQSTAQRRSLSPQSTPMLLQRPQGPRMLVRPIFPQDRGFLDRLVENLIGDGPNNRFALICQNCASHNGMALKEEFEYLAFKCVYCGFPNPSRKVRPSIGFDFPRRGLTFPGGGDSQAALEVDSANSSDTESGVKIEEIVEEPSKKLSDGTVKPEQPQVMSEEAVDSEDDKAGSQLSENEEKGAQLPAGENEK